MYGDGLGFVPDRLVADAPVAILAQNPGEDEEKGRRLVQYVGRDKVYESVTPQPLIGTTGYTLEKTYLPLAGLTREKVSYLNVLKCREVVNGKHTNKLPSGERYRQAVEQCTTAHLVMPRGARLVVAHGGPAWDVTQQSGGVGDVQVARPISEWRGYTGADYRWHNICNEMGQWPVLATLHTASLFRSPKMKQAAMADWRKIPRILAGTWPQALPAFVQCPSDVSLRELTLVLPTMFARVPRVALDTEYFYDPEAVPGEHKLSVIGVGGKDHDGQWVGFQVDCRLCGDTEVSDFILHGLRPAIFNVHPVIFQNAGADIPVLAWNAGAKLGGFNSVRHIEDLLLLHADLYSEQPHDLEYLASVYGEFPHTKHYLRTDLLKRNLGDVLETYVAFEKLEKEALLDKRVWQCYRERVQLIKLHTRATQVGLAVNQAMVTRLLREEIGTLKEALLMGRAYAGWPISLGSCGPQGQLATVLYKYLKLPAQRDRTTKNLSVGKDALAVLRRHVGVAPDPEKEDRDGLTVAEALERVEQGANPLLEARTVYAAVVQEIGHFLAPLVEG